ncbi:AAA family ATPase [Ralstonia soli]|uniref:AAA family ATPase n=1 Tax=Ralstonia soli TaxID=2953896 RepID=A0ABT1AJB5_9RALS|nr:AAA family ATPase [Ralstonia soli]MCO5398411.1 AAA family ATPase [Ralstonia soli]
MPHQQNPAVAASQATKNRYDLTKPNEAAEFYVVCGHPVVPVQPRAKNPYAKDWQQHPLRTVEDVQKHWAAYPDDNIGLFMGDEYVALDFDTKDGKAGARTLAWLAAKYPPVRTTLTQRSQSGGWHKLFKLKPEQQQKLRKHTNVKLGPCPDYSGLDIIAGNSILLAAPSATPVGMYRWKDLDADIAEMPDDLFELLLGLEHGGREPANDPAPQSPSAKPPKVELPDHIVALLKHGHSTASGYKSPSEARAAAYRALRTVGYTVDHIVSVLEKSPLRDHADTTRPPLSGDALRKDVESVLALPYTGSTGNTGDSGMPTPRSTPGLFKDYATLCGIANGRRWIVKGLIPSDGTGIIYGESGSYKTFVALDLALHIAHGMPWCGRKTVSGPVLYIAGEGGTSLRYRIEAWHQRHDLAPDTAALRVCTNPLPLNDATCVARVKAEIQRLRTEIGDPVLIVVDTLSQNFDGDENSSSEIATFLRTLATEIRGICPGSSLILIHHSGHDKTRARGSSAIRANSDFMFRMEGFAHTAKLIGEKMKDADLPEPLVFDLRVVNLDEDEDGTPISSLAAAFSDGLSTCTPATGPRRYSKHYAMLLTVMRGFKEGALEVEIREAFYKACPQLTEEARRQGFNRALETAQQDRSIVRSPTGVLSLAAGSTKDADDIEA